ncbi:spore cortex-lytic enzyme [[Clostridium] methylpentosum DSM 5476]|uniref:Spore cortex-lytic enzyme n=1 Tax=[Clostridium] methylpentosum DSM 5476 TaxID=537013 RepID=C0EA90_9FIRM|nr:spore cortex-lytic enzyme [[Clostridium] methylpentosum DSM 5476]MDY3987940.1 spore cortex-lytic enzyme [Massilioclostridium sp.]MEE1491808.1 spore cortex-lytic enzyme [Massilioclostridium sp.]
MKKKRKSTALIAIIVLLIGMITLSAFVSPDPPATETLSRLWSTGNEVTAIQQKLKERGLYTGNVDGIYGPNTQSAVIKFQKQQGLSADGIAGPATLKRLGITIGSTPSATTANVNLLARIISAEGRGESYTGQVAIGAVILNRIEHPSFPDTLSGVIYQPGAFTAVTDGQFNQPVASSCYDAARDALNGWDPSGGAIYYYNPSKTSNQWIRSRPVIKRIGNHLFCS